MAHFFVPPKNILGNSFHFDPSESRHLTKVLRKKPGDVIQIFNGEGLIRSAKILDLADGSKVAGEILDLPALYRPPALFTSPRNLRIYPSILKGPRFDWMVEKLTELGVEAIHPVFTVRTVVPAAAKFSDSKLKRWENIVLSAAKQCGRAVIPRVLPPVPFANAVESVQPTDISCVLWESEEKKSISDFFKDLKLSGKIGAAVNLFVGPEGGLTVEEANLAIRFGIVPVHLGENILRAETAAVAAASYLLLA